VFVPPIRRRLGILAAGLLAIAGLSVVDAAPSQAAAAHGYVRLAHLSPDTPDVDVHLSSLTGLIHEKVFPGVGYGVVSAYQSLPVGTYAVAMRFSKPKSPAEAQARLTTQVTVGAGQAYTVAGVGQHVNLGLQVIRDDLRLPGAARAKIRIIQASIKQPVLDVSLGGTQIASGVQFATTTAYRVVDPGTWQLRVGPAGGPATTLSAQVASGNVYSLIVLDGPHGLQAELRADAERNGAIPGDGVETGAGGTAPLPAAPAVAGGSLLVLVAAGLVFWRLRRGRTRTV